MLVAAVVPRVPTDTGPAEACPFRASRPAGAAKLDAVAVTVVVGRLRNTPRDNDTAVRAGTGRANHNRVICRTGPLRASIRITVNADGHDCDHRKTDSHGGKHSVTSGHETIISRGLELAAVPLFVRSGSGTQRLLTRS
jgi:hypothetical protein